MLGLGWGAEMYSGSGREESRSESRRYYNPYSSHLNLNGGSEQRSMENLYRLPTTPEFLFTEEATFQRRSFGENITYFTGCGYLGGAILGGMKGLVDGIRSREEGDTVKLQVNRVLNASGQTGRSIGNKLGVLGLLYAGMESGAYNMRGIDDVLNPVMAGLGTGAFYKAAAGPRTAAIAGALGGIAAGGIVAGKQACKRYLPI